MVKKSCRVEASRKVDRHEVGIWTVAKSSVDSSVDVPMKSNERQAHTSFSSQLIRLCCGVGRWGGGEVGEGGEGGG